MLEKPAHASLQNLLECDSNSPSIILTVVIIIIKPYYKFKIKHFKT